MKRIKFISIINTDDSYYTPLLRNLQCSLRKVGLIYLHEVIPVKGTFGVYGSSTFNQITFHKLTLVHEFLLSGYTVWFVDLDIVFLRNPLHYLLQIIRDFDFVAQSNDELYTTINTGFFIAKPTELVLDLFDTRFMSREVNMQSTDQQFINTKIRYMDHFKSLRYKLLDISLFPSGRFFYKRYALLQNPYIVHYNWLVGIDNKILKMKQYGHWFVD